MAAGQSIVGFLGLVVLLSGAGHPARADLGVADATVPALERTSGAPLAETPGVQAKPATPPAAVFPRVLAEPDVERDANVYVAPEHVPANDPIQAFSAATAPEAKAAGLTIPGLLSIASEAYRAQNTKGSARARKPYSLADAMRDAMWRKETAAKLKAVFANHPGL